MNYYHEFLNDLKDTVTEEEMRSNINFTEIINAVMGNDLSTSRITELFRRGEELAKKNSDEAQVYFVLLSSIPKLPSRYRDLAIESSLLIQGIEREEYDSLEQLMKKM